MSFVIKKKSAVENGASKTARIKCVDLFSGAGGLSLAAMEVGVEVVAAIERDRRACATYRRNFIEGRDDPPVLYDADILEIEPKRVVENHFAGGSVCDIVLGGPPCQGFSVHRIRNSGVGDPRNDLILRYFEFVSELRPQVFFMENVPGILWDRHKDYLVEFYSRGEEAGYRVLRPEILDARDYGIPQRRKRVFVLGVRKDVEFDKTSWPPPKTHGDEKTGNNQSGLKPWETAAAVFEKPAPPGDENDRHMNHSDELTAVFKSTPRNGGSRHQSNRVLPCHRNHNGHSDVYGRIDPSKPGPTMTTACINPSKGRFVHPTEHHGITLRQAARFQTFPDEFVFEGGLMAAGTQIGNAVPVDLGKILLKYVVSILNGKN